LKLAIPYSRKRRYLTGIDWVLGAMDHLARKSTGIGAISQAVLELEGRLDDNRLRAALGAISEKLPIVHGRVARDLVNFAPFWKVPGSVAGRAIALEVIDLPADAIERSNALLDDHANAPFPSESVHVRFLLIRLGGERSRLGMVFDHRLFDAFGAETFLRLIDETDRGNLAEIAPRIRVTAPAELDRWAHRFKSGRQLIDVMYPLNEKEICALQAPARGSHRRVRFVQERLSSEESARFDLRAGEESIVQILLPSAAARALLAFREVFPSSPQPGEQYLVFTSANQRAAGQEWESLFFNQFSFLMFTAPHDPKAAAPSELATLLRDQLFELMKQNIPGKMLDASALWRIFPHWVVSRIMNTLGKGRMCSMYFACVREGGYPGKTFLDLPLRDLTHEPLAFFPPGMNICMTQFAGRYNIVLSYVDGVLKDDEAKRIVQSFKMLLLE
jgi:hypothetical protein